MGKYAKFQRKSQPKREINPIWRGIGCLLFVIVPLMAYGLMLIVSPLIIKTGLVPYQMLGYVHFPVWAFKFQITSTVALFIGSLKDLWLNLAVFFLMVLILAVIISFSYTLLYQAIGPARYTAVDAPPSRHKAKVYKR